MPLPMCLVSNALPGLRAGSDKNATRPRWASNPGQPLAPACAPPASRPWRMSRSPTAATVVRYCLADNGPEPRTGPSASPLNDARTAKPAWPDVP